MVNPPEFFVEDRLAAASSAGRDGGAHRSFSGNYPLVMSK